jgi:hypothetical protein
MLHKKSPFAHILLITVCLLGFHFSYAQCIDATATITDSINCNGDSATVVISATGGTAPYLGMGTFVVPAGNYQYIVTDAGGCADTINLVLTQPAPLQIELLAISETCGSDSFQLTLGASGGTAPHTGIGTKTFAYGFAQATITDANGCQITQGAQFNKPDTLSASSQVQYLCNDTFAVTISATGGTFPYTGIGSYSLTAGNYNFVVTDGLGCTDTVNLVLAPVATLTATAVLDSVDCNGGVGMVTITASGGAAPYSGTGNFPVIAGNYVFTVFDANGCVDTVGVIVAQPSPIIVTVTADSALCKGDSIMVHVSATGGTAPYMGTGNYKVSNASTVTVTDAAGCTATAPLSYYEPFELGVNIGYSRVSCFTDTFEIIVNGIGGTAPYNGDDTFYYTPGVYYFTITDANGCSTNDSVVVPVPPAAVNASVNAGNINCYGQTATVNITATGGVSPYNNVGTFNLFAGSYTTLITDAQGCFDTVQYTLTEPAELVASATAPPITCSSGTTTVTVTATGGTGSYVGTGNFVRGAGNHQFIVSDANGCSDTVVINIGLGAVLNATATAGPAFCNSDSVAVTVSATGGVSPYIGTGSFTVVAGNYQFIVSDAGGCIDTAFISVAQPAALAASATASNIACNGGTTTVTVTATGGVQPYSGIGTFTVSAGTHQYIVTDNNGCADTVVINVTQNPALVVSTNIGAPILCNGGLATLVVSALGGVPPYTGTGTFQVPSGIYSGTVTDAAGCSQPVNISVTQPAALIASASVTNALCANGTGTIVVTATGGTGAYAGTGTFTVTPGTYDYIVSDANGCADTVTATVTSPNALSASSAATPALCFGSNGTVVVSAAGGVAPYTGTGTFSVAQGTYIYNVTDNNGCLATTTAVVTEPSQLIIDTTVIDANCFGDSGTVIITASGGTPPYAGTGTFTVAADVYQYGVTDANGCGDTINLSVNQPAQLQAFSTAGNIACNGGSASVTITAVGGTTPYSGEGIFTVVAGTHDFIVTDAHGCSDTTTITVSQPSVLLANASGGIISCNGDSAQVTVTASGGTGPYNGTGVFTVAEGVYEFIVTDNNGCSDTAEITVVNPLPLAATAGAGAILCNGDSADIVITATGGVAPYNGVGTFTVSAGTYSFIVNDANGCADTVDVTVSEPPLLVATATVVNPGCFNGLGSVDVQASGGVAPYAGIGIFNVAAGTQSFVVTDANGCTDSVTVTLVAPTELQAAITITQPLCFGDAGSVQVSATGGTAPYNGIGTFTVTAGNYLFTVTDGAGCSDTVSANIIAPTALFVAATVTDPLCNGGTGTVIISATGGTAPYAGTGSFSVNSGPHSFAVTDANGCSDTITVVVNEPAILVAASSNDTVNCFSDSGTITITATGGVPPYSGTGVFNAPSGVYDYVVNDANGCSDTVSAQIISPDPILLSGVVTVGTSPTPSNVALSVSGGVPPFTFEWSNGDTTQNLQNITVAGNYGILVTDANGCTDSIGYFVDFITGLKGVDGEVSIKLLPNPATEQVTIFISGQLTQTTKLRIYNSIGELVTDKMLNQEQATVLDIKLWAAGVYYVSLENANSRIVKILVKQQ